MSKQVSSKAKSSSEPRRNLGQQQARQHQARGSTTSRSGIQGERHYLQTLAATRPPSVIQRDPTFLAYQRRVGYSAAMSAMRRMAQQANSLQSEETQVQKQESEKASSPESVQAKLTTGKPRDKYEREADSAAAQVMANQPVQALTPIPASGLPQALTVQKLEAETEEPIQAKSLKSQGERSRSQTDANIEKRLNQPAGGRSLAAPLKNEMGTKFGADFSHVKVHDNTQAQTDAASLGAKAFTKGENIWLGQQASENDRELMAHELAHVVQQGKARQGAIQKTPLNNEAEPLQKAAVQKEENEDDDGWIMGRLKGFLRSFPGYYLLSVIIGGDPLSGKPVERSAVNMIRGVMGMIPGGELLFQQLNETGAVDRTGQWLGAEFDKLNLTWEGINTLFSQAWDAASIWSPKESYERIKSVFTSPIERISKFVGAIGNKILEFILHGALSMAGASGDTVMAFLKGAGKTFVNIINDPIGFLSNLLTAVKTGFGKFSANIGAHLQAGLVGWLFGTLASAGLQLPQKLDLKGILSLVLQVIGLTWAAIRKRIVKVIGEERMVKVEKTVGFVKNLITRGPIAAWEMITGAIGNLTDLVLGSIKNWVVTKVVQSAVTKLLSMFNPAGAIVQAGLAIYNVVMFFIERAQQIATLVQSIVSSITNIAAGAVGAAANFIEMTMARTLPVIISFLARLLGLSGIGETIKGLIKKVQQPIGKGIDAVVGWVVKKAKSLFVKGSDKKTDGDKSGADNLNPYRKLRAYDKAKIKADGGHLLKFENQGDLAVYSKRKDLDTLIAEKEEAFSSKSDSDPQKEALSKLKAENKHFESLLKAFQKKLEKYTGASKEYDAIIKSLQQMAHYLSIVGIDSSQSPLVKTYVEWATTGGKAEIVIAQPLTRIPGNTEGAPTSDDFPRGWEKVPPSLRRTHWVKAHLLNHQLHGPSHAWNLFPSTKKVNTHMRIGIEDIAKKTVKDEKNKNNTYYYDVALTYGNSDSEFPTKIQIEFGHYDIEKKAPSGIIKEYSNTNFPEEQAFVPSIKNDTAARLIEVATINSHDDMDGFFKLLVDKRKSFDFKTMKKVIDAVKNDKNEKEIENLQELVDSGLINL